MDYFWTINVSRTEHDWLTEHLSDALPANREDHPRRKYSKHWRHELNALERLDVDMITNDATNESWLTVTLTSEAKPSFTLDTVEIDEPIEFEIGNDTYTISIKMPEDTTIYVNQRPVDISYHCPTCEYDGNIMYDDFCTDHGEPCDWSRFECENCGQVIEIDNQEWC